MNRFSGELIGAAREASSSSREAGSAIARLPETVSSDRLAQLLSLVLGMQSAHLPISSHAKPPRPDYVALSVDNAAGDPCFRRTPTGSKTLSERMAKDVLAAMLAGDARPPADIARETHGGGVVSDDGTLRALCAEIVTRSPEEAELLRGGRRKLMGYFVGELMKATKGRADAQKATPYFAELIGVPLEAVAGAAGGGGGKGEGGGGGGDAGAGGSSGGGGGKKKKPPRS